MVISHVRLRNWRNFSTVDIDLHERVFIAGPNASGKSNFLDVFRFLRDIAKHGGGLQSALFARGGVSKIRCLAARRNPNIEIEVQLRQASGEGATWKYAIGIRQEQRGLHRQLLSYERVWKDEEQLLDRPDDKDESDSLRMTQTHLEQINANQNFREIYNALNDILYLHMIPQLLRYPDAFSGVNIPGDPFGRGFLERVATTPNKTRESRLKKIEKALRVAVPQLKQLTHVKDEKGVPHLEAVYEHWRPMAKQREDQFSDGTLRLLGLLWSLLEGDSLLLLEEPELSLNAAIVQQLPTLMYRLQKRRRRQIMVSTHSADLLSDKGIGAEEVVLLTPDSEGTKVGLASSMDDVVALLRSGMSVGEAVLPRTNPSSTLQLNLFD